MNPFSPEMFFDLSGTRASDLFKDILYVWDAVKALPAFIEKIIQPEILGEVEEGAWLEPGQVQLEEGSRVERGAIVRGPTIIGRGTVIRTGAYIRGHVMTGEQCLIGHGTELRQTLILNQSNVPHQNCVFTSLLGNRVKLGGVVNTANLRGDGKEVFIQIDLGAEKKSFSTGQILFGAVIGDDTNIGGHSMLNPGCLIGKRSIIYPGCFVSGSIPHDSIVKSKFLSLEVIPRTEKV